MKLRKFLVISAVVAALLTIPVGQALAYGHADQPLAQIEFSANCTSPSNPFCSEGVGTGGIWLWIEIDAGGTGDVAGAGCGHVVGGGGPGLAGGGSIRGDIAWYYSSFENLPPNAFAFVQDPGDQYYVVLMPDGEAFAFPVTPGHYTPPPDLFGPGVEIQLQVAP